MKTAIMTDTNSGFSVQNGLEKDIFVLSMPVIIDEQSYSEGVDITQEQLFAALREKRGVHSSQPSPGDLTEMWDNILGSGWDELVYIPMSSGLSGSCQTARQLAMDYGGKVVVADNHRISVTLYESVLEARRMADAGMGAYDIAQHLEAHAVDSSIYITVDSLEYLKRSGRVTPAGAAIANVLNLKPVLTIQGGKLDAYAKVRGMRLSEKRMIEATADDLSRRFSSFPKDRIRIGAAGTFENPEDAAHWRDQLAAAFPECQVYYQPLSCSIACHVGIDAVGLGISCVQS